MYNTSVARPSLMMRVQCDDCASRLFLRTHSDALPEYSKVPWDMEPEQHPENTPVPVDETKVVMKPRPWTQRWERKELKGIGSFEFRRPLEFSYIRPP